MLKYLVFGICVNLAGMVTQIVYRELVWANTGKRVSLFSEDLLIFTCVWSVILAGLYLVYTKRHVLRGRKDTGPAAVKPATHSASKSALTTCPHCKASVSRNAQKCPKCSARLRGTKVNCRSCGTSLFREDMMFSGSYMVDGNTRYSSSQRPCPNCGEPRPLPVSNTALVFYLVGAVLVGVFAVALITG
jgi:hypothetical protein